MGFGLLPGINSHPHCKVQKENPATLLWRSLNSSNKTSLEVSLIVALTFQNCELNWFSIFLQAEICCVTSEFVLCDDRGDPSHNRKQIWARPHKEVWKPSRPATGRESYLSEVHLGFRPKPLATLQRYHLWSKVCTIDKAINTTSVS